MPQKLNKAGKMQDYVPKGNGDASGEYGTSNGTNKNFTESDNKKTPANVILENKNVSIDIKGKETPNKALSPSQWKKVGDIAYDQSKPSIKIAEEIWKLQDEFGYDINTAIKKLKENYQKKEQEKIDEEEQKRLDKILRERGAGEDSKQAKDSNYFGYGSLDKLEEAHKNDYEEDSKVNIIDDDLSGKKEKETITKLDTPQKKEIFKNALSKALENAKKEYDKNKEDGGASNMDTCRLYLKNMNLSSLEKLVKEVDSNLHVYKVGNGAYHITGYGKGQGNLNSRMVEALQSYGFDAFDWGILD